MIRKTILLGLCGALLILPGCQTNDRIVNEAQPPQPSTLMGGPLVNTPAPPKKGTPLSPIPHPSGSIVLGGSANSPLDKSDHSEIARAEVRAFTAPIGQQVTWNNKATGHSGTILPVRDVYARTGAYCREFQQTFVTEASPQRTDIKACQQPDGSWKIAP